MPGAIGKRWATREDLSPRTRDLGPRRAKVRDDKASTWIDLARPRSGKRSGPARQRALEDGARFAVMVAVLALAAAGSDAGQPGRRGRGMRRLRLRKPTPRFSA